MSACRPSETRRRARTLGRSRCEKTACCISAGRSSKTSATDIARRPAGARAGVRACRPRRGVSGHLTLQGLMQQYPSHRNHMCMTYLNYTSVTKYCTVPEVASCAEELSRYGLCCSLSHPHPSPSPTQYTPPSPVRVPCRPRVANGQAHLKKWQSEHEPEARTTRLRLTTRSCHDRGRSRTER